MVLFGNDPAGKVDAGFVDGQIIDENGFQRFESKHCKEADFHEMFSTTGGYEANNRDVLGRSFFLYRFSPVIPFYYDSYGLSIETFDFSLLRFLWLNYDSYGLTTILMA